MINISGNIRLKQFSTTLESWLAIGIQHVRVNEPCQAKYPADIKLSSSPRDLLEESWTLSKWISMSGSRVFFLSFFFSSCYVRDENFSLCAPYESVRRKFRGVNVLRARYTAILACSLLFFFYYYHVYRRRRRPFDPFFSSSSSSFFFFFF